MTRSIAIHWFRQDLRLTDNPALLKAARHGRVLPIYILEEERLEEEKLEDHKPEGGHSSEWAPGAASRWWLHHSLVALKASLGGNLSLYRGDPAAIIEAIAERWRLEAVYWNRCYEPWRMTRDAALKARLKARGIHAESAQGALLWEPWTIHKNDGTPYKVFTPFYRKGCLRAPPPREPLPAAEEADAKAPAANKVRYDRDDAGTLEIEQLELLPPVRWDQQLEPHWTIGEAGARARFHRFIEEGLPDYKEKRNLPASPHVSRLSPHLHFGEISPHQLWHGVRSLGEDANIEHFCSELGWREFSCSQLYYNPDLPSRNLQAKFDAFPWVEDDTLLKAWQDGQTGIPMVDAGMRELWHTGYMHNRVRMIVGSFLVKNLRLHWYQGERWFWDTLVDADLANNSASWQWIAGCGADAAPYFRIFNPVTQGQKFDPEGAYVRRFIPEIAPLPDKYLFCPWEAPAATLEQAGVQLGVTYPRPVVDLKASRQAALTAFKTLSKP